MRRLLRVQEPGTVSIAGTDEKAEEQLVTGFLTSELSPLEIIGFRKSRRVTTDRDEAPE